MKNYRIKKLSLSRARSRAEYTKAYKKQDQQLIDEFGYIPCSSCGIILVNGNGKCVSLGYGHSHNLSVKHYPEFEADPENFKPRCNDCHKALDFPDFSKIIKFKDFDQLMEYRRIHSKLAYNQWVTKLKEIGYTEYDYLD